MYQKEENEREERDRVEGAISKERPPGEVEHRLGEERAHPDNEEDVEDGRADDGADADVGEGDEDTDDGGEELGRRTSGRHESGSGYVLWASDDLDDDVEGWDEELVADDGQSDEHVHHASHVKNDTTLKQIKEVNDKRSHI